MKKKKKTIFTKIVWAGKSEKPKGISRIGCEYYFHSDGFYTKGKCGSWAEEDWPPQRVRVTLEWLDARKE